MSNIYENIYVILVEPVYKGNIGAVSRIMKNFGFSHLRIVGTIPEKEDFALAVHSLDILENTQIYENLEKAVADLDRAVAISRRNARRKNFDFNPPELSEFNQHNESLKLGLVFGRETFGLTREEEDFCNLRCYIPSNPEFPSLNLSHSVTVILYELYKNSIHFSSALKRKDKSVTIQDIDETADYIIRMLQGIGFFNRGNENQIRFIFRNMLAKANIGKTTNHKIKKIFERIWALHNQKTLRDNKTEKEKS